LKALGEATQIALALRLPEERLGQLRNEAIACLALPDIRLLREWDCPVARPTRFAFDSELRYYAFVNDESEGIVRRMEDDTSVIQLPGAEFGPEFSPDGQFVAIATREAVSVWHLVDNTPVRVLHEQVSDVQLAAFRPDGVRIAIADATGGITAYHLPSGKRFATLTLDAPPLALAYHPFQDQLAVALPARARIYDLEAGTCLWDTPQSYDPWPAISWHPDGRFLAMAEKDWIISLWDI
jgi:WD40 repeat protein